MSILTKSFNIDFTQVPNQVINDNKVSLKAKGLYLFMVSKPDNWKFSLNGMESQLKESRKVILGIIEELISLGYMDKIKNRVNGRQAVNDYILHLTPQNRTECQKETQKKRLSNSDSVNDTTSNTITNNTNSSNTNNTNTKLRDIEKEDFNQFREKFKDVYSREHFIVDGVGFDNVPLIINTEGLILNISRGIEKSFYIRREESLLIWEHLYNNFDRSLL